MSGAHAYYQLAALAERRRLPLGDLLDEILPHIWITLPAYDAACDETNIEVLVDQPVGIKVPGIPALELALGSVAGGVNATLRARHAPTAGISIEMPLTLRVAADVLRPLQPNSIKPDLTRKTLDISLGSARVGFDLDGHFLLDVTGGITLPRCMIGSTGVILSANNVRWLTPNAPSLPATMPSGFTGLYFEGATIEVPELPIGQLAMRDVFLGTGGFSGTVQWSDPNAAWSGTGSSGNFTGVAVGQLAGFRGALTKVALGFQQNALTACEIEGNVFVPYIDRVLGISLGLDGNFGLTATVRTPTCRFADAASQAMAAQAGPNGYILRADTAAFILDINRIQFHAGGNEPAALTLSGRVKLKLAALDLPGVVFQGLRIDTNGQVAVDGGWLDVAQSKSADLKGFPLQITKIGFGADTPRKRWIGLNGGIKLAKGLPLGASVEGLRVSWDLDTGQIGFALEGIGLKVEVPKVYSFDGKVAFFENAQASGFRGTVKLKLQTVKLTIDASLIVGRTTDGTDFFYFYLDLDLPAGIPLFSTGAAIYGFSGLLAANMTPARQNSENWYHGYYKRAPVGVTDAAKWAVTRDAFALGVGTTIGSLPDTGFSISAKILLLLVLPGPQLLLQGRGSFLKKKPDQKDPTAEGAFEALLVLDVPAKLFQANLAVAFSIADLVEAAGGLDAAFSWSATPPADLWHVYLGEKTPEERRIHATLFKLFRGDQWLMINSPHSWPQGLPDREGPFEIGGSTGLKFDFDFTVVKAWLDASITGQAAVSPNPQQFKASLDLRGAAGISMLGFSIVAELLAQAQVQAPNPWHLSILVEVGIKIELIVTRFEFNARLPLEFGDANSPLPQPVRDFITLHADHAKVDEARPLAQARIAPDARPLLVFDRPVQDRTRFGAPARDNTPADDLGLRQVSYRLQHVVLLARAPAGEKLIAAAGEVSISTTTASFIGLQQPADQLPDLSNAELTLIAPGQTIGPIRLASGSGNSAVLSQSVAAGDYSYRLSAPRPRSNVQITTVRTASFGNVEVMLSAALSNPSEYRGGTLAIGGATWRVLDANAATLRLRVESALPASGTAVLEGPPPPTLDGKWYPAGDPVTGPSSSTRLQLWAKTPYSFFRHNEASSIDGLDAFQPGYACGPQPVEEPICTYFEDLSIGALGNTFRTNGIDGTATGTVTVAAANATRKCLLLGNFAGNNGTGRVVFDFNPPVDAVWITAETREGGRITALREGAVVGIAPLQQKEQREEFNGGIDRLEVDGVLATIHTLCFTPGWTCVSFNAAFPQPQAGSTVYTGLRFQSDGSMAVLQNQLQVDAPTRLTGNLFVLQGRDDNGRMLLARKSDAMDVDVEANADGGATSEELRSRIDAITITPGIEEAFQEEAFKPLIETGNAAIQPMLELAVPRLEKAVFTEIPGLGPVRLKPGFTTLPGPDTGVVEIDPRITLLPDSYTRVEPWRLSDIDIEFVAPFRPSLGKVLVDGGQVSIVTLTITFPRPVTQVRVRLGSAADVIGFAGTAEVTRSSGRSGDSVSLSAGSAHLGWIDRVVLIAAGQLRISELCTDAGNFGWQRYEQWKWADSVHRSVESLYSEDPVLRPGEYQLRVHTSTVVTGAQPETVFDQTAAMFTVGAPAGFPTAPNGGVQTPTYPEGGPLTDLVSYVAGTMPPAGAQLWYRRYDTAVRFNENYVTRMYLDAGHELGVWVTNPSGTALRDGVRHVWSRVDNAIDTWTEHFMRTLNGDGTDPCATVDVSKIVQPEQVTAGSGEVLEPSRLHMAELRSRNGGRVLHRFEFTTSAFTGLRHHFAGFDGRCRVPARSISAQAVTQTLAQRVGARSGLLEQLSLAITSANAAQAAATAQATDASLAAQRAALDTLSQLRQQLRTQAAADFDALWASCIGTEPPPGLPQELRLYCVTDHAGQRLLLLESPEPIAWERMRLRLARSNAVALRKRTITFDESFGRPDSSFEVQFGGLRWRGGVELWVVDGAVQARAAEPLQLDIFTQRAQRVELSLRIAAGGSAVVTTTPPLPSGGVTYSASATAALNTTVTLTAPAGGFDSVRVSGSGVALAGCTVVEPLLPVPPSGPLRIIDVELPTTSAPLDHALSLIAFETAATNGYTVRWIDASNPSADQLYSVIQARTMQAGQVLRLVPGRPTAPASGDAIVQAGGPGSTPPVSGAVLQLIGPDGRVYHEYAALPSAAPQDIIAFPNADGTRAFLALPTTATMPIGAGAWVLRATLSGDVGPDLDRWSIGNLAVEETASLFFQID
jgi:hypothetical protein